MTKCITPSCPRQTMQGARFPATAPLNMCGVVIPACALIGLALLLNGMCLAATVSHFKLLSMVKEKYKNIDNYQCTISAYNELNGRVQEKVVRYYYKKPGLIRIESVSREDKGSVVICRDNKIFIRKPGILSVFIFVFDPEDKRTKSIRGEKLSDTGWDAVIRQFMTAATHGKLTIGGLQTVGEYRCRVLNAARKNVSGTGNISKEKLWIDEKTHISIRYAQYEPNGKIVHLRKYTGIKINQHLPDKLFDVGHGIKIKVKNCMEGHK